MRKILVVDDDSDLRMTVTSALSEGQYEVDEATNGEEAVTRVQAGQYDLVLMDVNMPKMSGIEALKEIKAHDPSVIVIILTAFSNIRDAIEATRLGAYNYLEKPIRSDNLVYMVDQAFRSQNMVKALSYSAPVFSLPGGNEFVGQSSEMKKIFSVIDRLARVDTAVLIRGESGTGKELVAQSLHYNGPRKDNRFVAVNCSAIPENLMESEFFGHEKGAFTGADSRKIGKFQYAEGGTLFLDEIGEIPASMQAKLLRVLQEKKFTPVGSNREIDMNVRIVAATNRNLESMIKDGSFREDLFYRLNVLPIQLPPLRERRNDLESLSRYFVEKFNQRYKKQIRGLSEEALEALKAQRWPGNIRELENVLEHAFVLESTSLITMESLPEKIIRSGRSDERLSPPPAAGIQLDEGSVPMEGEAMSFRMSIQKFDFQASKEEFEKQFLINALKAFRGKINQTALHANIPKKTLLRKLEKYGITAKDYNN
ncbi:sigma-54-dependent Fis family transcriptional regulator [bacterium]|jgi:DNA-binding NtrC family response regulator|nr:sigma-54-dependent Fis family transcriptional regulator [bacterium]